MGMSITGEIVDFVGSWGSGLAQLVVKDDSGTLHGIVCENAPTVRALDAAFDCIRAGHRLDVDAVCGNRIEVFMDDMGLMMEGFNVIGE